MVAHRVGVYGHSRSGAVEVADLVVGDVQQVPPVELGRVYQLTRVLPYRRPCFTNYLLCVCLQKIVLRTFCFRHLNIVYANDSLVLFTVPVYVCSTSFLSFLKRLLISCHY